jgi:hypothetical protein
VSNQWFTHRDRFLDRMVTNWIALFL